MKKNYFFYFCYLLVLALLWHGGNVWATSNSCFKCHKPDGFKGKVVHSPVAKGACDACHNPHVSRYDNLLTEKDGVLCFSCHKAFEKRLSADSVVHDPVLQAQCSVCHAPHASEFKALQRHPAAETCFSCHKTLQKSQPFVHAPFAKGECDKCHDPHSSRSVQLLRQKDPQLCLGCHSFTAMLTKKHLGRQPQKMHCLGCHSPHGSSEATLIRSTLHTPFAEKRCDVCHGRKNETSLCLGCHAGVMDSFYKTNTHLVGGEGNVCLSCHSPHAGDQPGLLAGGKGQVCRSCHADTFNRREPMLHKHPNWNACGDCHQVHGADRTAMLRDEPDKVCGRCHERHLSFVHPLGEKALDPRDGTEMDCNSCHDANTGTMFKYNLRGESDRGLCIQCHQGY